MSGFIHDPAAFIDHDQMGHPENQRRLSQLEDFSFGEQVPLRPATDEELLTVHTPGHLHRIASCCASGGGMLDEDTYCTAASDAIVRKATGGLIDLCLAVHNADHANGLALLRPPGHHATADQTMGFCLYNHVAAAAAILRKNGAARVAIVDIDVHHGNGTQDIFYLDETVLYISTHQYPHFPGTGEATELGAGPGLGFTINRPLMMGTADEGFLAAYREDLLPALKHFKPEFILVSAGYDAHENDPLAHLMVTTEGYRAVVQDLVDVAEQVCSGRIVFSLEGGYDAPALADCVKATAEVLSKA